MTETMTEDSCLRIDGKQLVLKGEPIRLFSGAMHYFRTLAPQWPDRLSKLKAMGLNTIETYVPWNLHEKQPGVFDYEGLADLPAFIEAVAAQGMHMIVRPGPYICAEWEFGGLPAWLLVDDETHLRSAHAPYLAAVDRFFDDLIPRLVPYAAENGGPIIAMQVENEYGSYGGDKVYLNHLARGLRSRGYRGLLFTSDGPTDPMLTHGTLPHIWKTANFGSRAVEGFDKLAEYEDGPQMCMEFWNGWFDHWDEEHHTRSAEDAAEALDEMLTAGGHVNFYMGHGGTNFGFWSGANTDETGRYQPTTTSYDYDCPLTEAGDITPKYEAFKAVLARHGAVTGSVAAAEPRMAETASVAEGYAGLFDNLGVLGREHRLIAPVAMEKLGQNSGLVLYRTQINHPAGTVSLQADVRDRAQVFLDGVLVGLLERNGTKSLSIEISEGPHQLDLLAENQGRVNYGKQLRDRKGLLGPVWLDYSELTHWTAHTLPLDRVEGLDFASEAPALAVPGFHRFAFDIAEPRDAYLDLSGWSKGVAYFNGFNLGRYWAVGPQLRLYVPYPLMTTGKNTLVLFETDGAGTAPRLMPEQAWLKCQA